MHQPVIVHCQTSSRSAPRLITATRTGTSLLPRDTARHDTKAYGSCTRLDLEQKAAGICRSRWPQARVNSWHSLVAMNSRPSSPCVTYCEASKTLQSDTCCEGMSTVWCSPAYKSLNFSSSWLGAGLTDSSDVATSKTTKIVTSA